MKISAIVLWLWCCAAVVADNSIMELINADQVGLILKERQLNQTRERSKNPWDPLAEVNGDDELIEENSITDINTNSIIVKHDRKEKLLPDFSTVLSGLYRTDKLLKSDATSLVVTKKEYLRKDWCRTEAIAQKIREEGCTPKSIMNRFCYGQCNSFYIPKNLTPRRGKKRRGQDGAEESPSFRSCGVCKPKRTSWVNVSLHCPGLSPPIRRRKVLKVKQCQCIAESTK